MNIGITVQINEKGYPIWVNGIRQNLIFFAKILMNIGKHNVYITNIKNDSNIPITNELPWDINVFKTVMLDDIKDDLDVLFVMGSAISPEDGIYLKNRGCKIVYYSCGTQYIMEMEEILFKEGKGKFKYEGFLDEIWIVPQMEKSAYYYFETLNRVKVRTIPFVWDPMFIDQLKPHLPNNGMYVPKEGPKRISCFEPNINVVKFCMYDILITERAYRKRPDLINHFYITNSTHLKDKERFVSIMNQLDVVKKGIASFESRYNMPYFLSTYTDVVVAHQWENPLNYAYLDAIYLGYPIVHNAYMCKEAGYFYNDFNAQEGEEQLLYALEHHDKNIDAYEFNTKKTLDRFLTTNPESIETYDRLLNELVANYKTEPMDIIENKYQYLCAKPSDIHQHLPLLKKYASECDSVTELGVRTGVSTWAFVSGKPKKMRSYDITDQYFIDKEQLSNACKQNNIDFEFWVEDSLELDMEPTDLLFINTYHTYNQLSIELKNHSYKVSKYIIMHDTVSFGTVDEEPYDGINPIIKSMEKRKLGLYNAVLDFIEENKQWVIKEDLKNNNGIVVLERMPNE